VFRRIVYESMESIDACLAPTQMPTPLQSWAEKKKEKKKNRHSGDFYLLEPLLVTKQACPGALHRGPTKAIRTSTQRPKTPYLDMI